MPDHLYTPGKRAGPLGTLYDRPQSISQSGIPDADKIESHRRVKVGRNLLDAFKHKPQTSSSLQGQASTSGSTAQFDTDVDTEADGDLFTPPQGRTRRRAQSLTSPRVNNATPPKTHASWLSRLTRTNHAQTKSTSIRTRSNFVVFQDQCLTADTLPFQNPLTENFDSQDNDENAPPETQLPPHHPTPLSIIIPSEHSSQAVSSSTSSSSINSPIDASSPLSATLSIPESSFRRPSPLALETTSAGPTTTDAIQQEETGPDSLTDHTSTSSSSGQPDGRLSKRARLE